MGSETVFEQQHEDDEAEYYEEDEAVDFQAEAALEDDSSMYETMDLEDEDAHLEAEFQARLQQVQQRAAEAGSVPTTLQTAPWPMPRVPANAPVGTLLLYSAAHSIPHPDKRHKGGEDAFFVSNSGCGALGVADGVGGWIEDGIDPGDYSRYALTWWWFW